MGSILKNNSIRRFLCAGVMAMMTFVIAACGGGGGSAGITTTGNTGAGGIAIALTDASGAAKNAVTTGNPLIATVKVTDSLGKPLKDKIVTFSVGSALATISPASGTALTDENGLAQVSIVSAGLGSGATTVSATTTVGASSVTATAPFSVGPAPVQTTNNGAIRLVLTNASGVASNAVTSTSPLLAVATVTDDLGKPLKNKIVTFKISDSIATVSPTSGTALTDANGVAQVSIVSAGTGAGATQVTASVTVGKDPVTASAAFSVAAPPVNAAGNGSIRIALTNQLGQTSNTIPTGGSLLVTATVTDDLGKPVANKVVTFKVSSAIAVVSPSDATALTDDSGIAKVSLFSTDKSAGAAEVTATVTVGTSPVSATAAFAVGAPAAPVNTTGTIQIILTDGSGAPKNVVTSGNPLLARATVLDNFGAPLANKLVTYSVSSSIVTISPAAATALTDASGVAQVSIQSAGVGGAGEITASVNFPTATSAIGTTVSAKAAFSVGAAATAKPVAINFVSAIPSDKSIVIKGAGGNGRTEVALLTFSVIDNTNSGVANANVTFSLVTNPVVPPSIPVKLSSTTGTTDQGGLVTVALSSGTDPTTVRVIATVTGTNISALSDQVTVTTGQPAQIAFTLSLAKYYVEGLNYDNTQNNVQVLLADSFGGAVADGTQVVFTTDSGAIFGSGGSKCLTVNGTCSVTWRSQNPRITNGLGSIVATATNAGTNLTASTYFYYSGSFATVYQVAPGSVAGNTVRIAGGASPGGSIATGSFATNCTPQSIGIELVDVNGNPMPEGTKLSAVNGFNAGATFSPDTVTNTGLRVGLANRGTVHNMTVTPTGCDVTGTKDLTGFIDISVKTPLGGETFTRVSLGAFKGK